MKLSIDSFYLCNVHVILYFRNKIYIIMQVSNKTHGEEKHEFDNIK